MPGWLTTHVLDTARGCPAKGVRIELYRIRDDRRDYICAVETNADGRTDAPILPEGEFHPGEYELIFHAGPYLEAHGAARTFLDTVPIRFRMTEEAHYHVPLLLSPFGYSTYRGS